jgi:hypothetical protein
MLRYKGHLYRLAEIKLVDSEFVQQWRLDLLRLLRSLKHVKDYDTAVEFQDVLVRYRKAFEETIIKRFIETQVRYELGLDEHTADRWYGRLRKAAYDLYYDLTMPFSRDPNVNKDTLYHRFVGEGDRWVKRIQRKARDLWKEMKLFLDQFPHLLNLKSNDTKPYVETLNVDNYSIDGFDVQLIGYNQGGLAENHPRLLAQAKRGFKKFAQKAKSKFPFVYRHRLPAELYFNATLNKGGVYEKDHIEIYMSALYGSDSMSFEQIYAHEMGHFVYRNYLGEAQTNFWHKAVKADYGKHLDWYKVLELWPEDKEYLFTVDDHLLDLGRYVLYLQLTSLLYSNDRSRWYMNATREKVEQQAEEDRYEIVPANPISAYANKNPEEAFCEAFSRWLIYGDRAVLPIVRNWLSVILPDATIRTANA